MSNHEQPSEMSILVADFGEAFITKDTSDEIGGTFPYKAPERSSDIITNKSDLWSCGVIIYEMIHLKWPFRDLNEMNSEKYHLLKFDATLNVSNELKPLLIE